MITRCAAEVALLQCVVSDAEVFELLRQLFAES